MVVAAAEVGTPPEVWSEPFVSTLAPLSSLAELTRVAPAWQ